MQAPPKIIFYIIPKSARLVNIAHIKIAAAHKCSGEKLFYGAVRIKQRQFFQVDQVLPILGITLGKNGHSAGNDTASLLHQGLQGSQAFAGGDHIVHHQNFLTLH